MVTDTPLAGAAHPAVQHPVPNEVSHRAIVRLDGKLDRDDAVGFFQKLDEAGLEIGYVTDGVVKLLLGDVKGVEVFAGLSRKVAGTLRGNAASRSVRFGS